MLFEFMIVNKSISISIYFLYHFIPECKTIVQLSLFKFFPLLESILHFIFVYLSVAILVKFLEGNFKIFFIDEFCSISDNEYEFIQVYFAITISVSFLSNFFPVRLLTKDDLQLFLNFLHTILNFYFGEIAIFILI